MVASSFIFIFKCTITLIAYLYSILIMTVYLVMCINFITFIVKCACSRGRHVFRGN